MPYRGLDRGQTDLQHHYEVHAWRRVHLEKLLVAQTVNKFNCLILNLNFHYRVHNSPSLAVTWTRTIRSTSCTLNYKTVFNIILPYTPQSFKQTLQAKFLSSFPMSSMRTTCPAHLILLLFIAAHSVDKYNRSRSTSPCRFFQLPVCPSVASAGHSLLHAFPYQSY